MEKSETRYTVKGLKTFVGMEGMGGFNVTLCRNEKPVAMVINDDSGGDFCWEWKSKSEEAILSKHCKSLPPGKYYDGTPMTVTPDIYVCELIDIYEQNKKIQRKCKSHLCFRLKSDEPGAYRTVKLKTLGVEKYCEKVKILLAKTYGDNVELIYNEL
ncbi:MAG TPA: hypothetical protein PKO34_00925 [Smithellaceae bacterium]|nr:MAG: hypothetical protein BWY15_02296 [Firmicutes bacterium ADurb.Bin193]HNS55588.1 hypothetical protein [Smithellaceae bacterium]